MIIQLTRNVHWNWQAKPNTQSSWQLVLFEDVRSWMDIAEIPIRTSKQKVCCSNKSQELTEVFLPISDSRKAQLFVTRWNIPKAQLFSELNVSSVAKSAFPTSREELNLRKLREGREQLSALVLGNGSKDILALIKQIDMRLHSKPGGHLTTAQLLSKIQETLSCSN